MVVVDHCGWIVSTSVLCRASVRFLDLFKTSDCDWIVSTSVLCRASVGFLGLCKTSSGFPLMYCPPKYECGRVVWPSLTIVVI